MSTETLTAEQIREQAAAETDRLNALRQKIERGTENLALADRQDFAAISQLLVKWREEEAVLVDRIERHSRALEPLPEALEVIAEFGDLRQKLKLADRVKLAHAVKQTVVSITIGIRQAKTGKLSHPEHFGELRLHAALRTKPIPIPDTAIGYRKIWRELADLVRQSDRPLHLADFCKYLGTSDQSHAAYHVRRAEKAGMIRKIGSYGGWVAVD
jgi:hypothetical protein